MRIHRTPDGRTELVLRGRDAALLFAVLLVLLIGAAGRMRPAEAQCEAAHCVGVPGASKLAAGATETPTIAVTPVSDPRCGTPPFEPAEGLQAWAVATNDTSTICARLIVSSKPVYGFTWQVAIESDTVMVFESPRMSMNNNTFSIDIMIIPFYVKDSTVHISASYLGVTYTTNIVMPSIPPTPTP